MMKISIISGSHRASSQSEKVGRFVEKVLRAEQVDASLLSLANNPLPLWDESIWSESQEWSQRLESWTKELAASDGFVVISPEWHGQVPSGLRNFFLLWGSGDVLAHKPALIISVSSSIGGAYPIAELRMSSYKNNRICYLPEHVIVRNVESVLNEAPENNDAEADTYFRERITWSLAMLQEYAKALLAVRASGITSNDKFQNGM